MSEKSALVVDAVVRDGDVHVTDAFFADLRKKSAKKWGDGLALKIRIEPADDAYTYAQLKGYWGYVVAPIVAYTGHGRMEVHAMFKAALLPEGKTSLTELSRDEMDQFISEAKVLAHEEVPEAFANAA